MKYFALATLLVASSLCVAWAQEPGQRLSSQEVSRLAATPSIALGKQHYRVLPTQVSPTRTLVANAQGVVGVSHHQVMVSGVPAQQLRTALQDPGLPRAQEVVMAENLDLATLRYASFEEAVRAHKALQALLPSAKLVVPVQYSTPRPR